MVLNQLPICMKTNRATSTVPQNALPASQITCVRSSSPPAEPIFSRDRTLARLVFVRGVVHIIKDGADYGGYGLMMRYPAGVSEGGRECHPGAWPPSAITIIVILRGVEKKERKVIPICRSSAQILLVHYSNRTTECALREKLMAPTVPHLWQTYSSWTK